MILCLPGKPNVSESDIVSCVCSTCENSDDMGLLSVMGNRSTRYFCSWRCCHFFKLSQSTLCTLHQIPCTDKNAWEASALQWRLAENISMCWRNRRPRALLDVQLKYWPCDQNNKNMVNILFLEEVSSSLIPASMAFFCKLKEKEDNKEYRPPECIF